MRHVSNRTLPLVATLSLLGLFAPMDVPGVLPGPSRVLAADFPYVGAVVEQAVDIYSGAGESYYKAGELRAGDLVEVHNHFHRWFKIAPPPGVTSYVQKAFVNRHGDGAAGTANSGRVVVTTASVTGPPGASYRQQRFLQKGQEVQIVDDVGDFFKIVPPQGAFVFLPPGSVRMATAEQIAAQQTAPAVATQTPPAPAALVPDETFVTRVVPAPTPAPLDVVTVAKAGAAAVWQTPPAATGATSFAPPDSVASFIETPSQIDQYLEIPAEAAQFQDDPVQVEQSVTTPAQIDQYQEVPAQTNQYQEVAQQELPQVAQFQEFASQPVQIEPFREAPQQDEQLQDLRGPVSQYKQVPVQSNFVQAPSGPIDQRPGPPSQVGRFEEVATRYKPLAVATAPQGQFQTVDEPIAVAGAERLDRNLTYEPTAPEDDSFEKIRTLVAARREKARAASPVKTDSPRVASAEENLQANLLLPLDRQPLEDLIATYQELHDDSSLSRGDRRLVRGRLRQLRQRQILAAKLGDLSDFRGRLQVRRAEAMPRIPGQSPRYAAVGQLLSSVVYNGENLPLMYRVVDPASFRTLAYIKPGTDGHTARCLGHLVGVLGTSGFDQSIQAVVINAVRVDLLEPTGIEAHRGSQGYGWGS
jgi:hypothetical protein